MADHPFSGNRREQTLYRPDILRSHARMILEEASEGKLDPVEAAEGADILIRLAEGMQN